MEVFYQSMSGVGMIVTFGAIFMAIVRVCQFIHGAIVGIGVENYRLKHDIEDKQDEILELRAQIEHLTNNGKK